MSWTWRKSVHNGLFSMRNYRVSLNEEYYSSINLTCIWISGEQKHHFICSNGINDHSWGFLRVFWHYFNFHLPPPGRSCRQEFRNPNPTVVIYQAGNKTPLIPAKTVFYSGLFYDDLSTFRLHLSAFVREIDRVRNRFFTSAKYVGWGTNSGRIVNHQRGTIWYMPWGSESEGNIGLFERLLRGNSMLVLPV